MRRGEIWLVNLDPTVGSEIKKTRPCVIISNDAVGILPLKIVVPLTEWNVKFARAPWMVRVDPDDLNRLNKPSAVDAFQIRSVSEIRLVERMGLLKNAKLDEIVEAILTVVSAV